MNPKVSVVIPTYNRADKVGKAIESALEQTFSELEVIVVDDGSSDDTADVLKKAFHDRIYYFAQTNQGASVARNRGIELARGEWIAFLDSDDIWEKDKLEQQIETLKQFPGCGGCYTDVRFYNHEERRTMFEMAEDYRHQGEAGINDQALRLLVKPGGAGMVICLSSFMVRADIATKNRFDPKLLYSQDSDFMFRLALLTNFCYVNRPLVRFDRSPGEIRHVGVSADWDKMEFFLKDSQLRLEGLLRLNGALPRPVLKVVRERLRSVHSAWTNWYLQSGQYDMARRSASKAIRTDPTFNVAVKWLLTWMSPRMALRTVQHHVRIRKDSGGFV